MPCGAGSVEASGVDLDLKAAARHAQRLHACGDVLGQRAAGRRAPRGELLRERAIAFECGGLILAQRGEIGVGALDFVELRIQLRGALRQLLRRDAILARQLLDRREARLDLILPRGVDIQRLEVVLQLARRFANLNRGALDQRQRSRRVSHRPRRDCAAPAARG